MTFTQTHWTLSVDVQVEEERATANYVLDVLLVPPFTTVVNFLNVPPLPSTVALSASPASV